MNACAPPTVTVGGAEFRQGMSGEATARGGLEHGTWNACGVVL